MALVQLPQSQERFSSNALPTLGGCLLPSPFLPPKYISLFFSLLLPGSPWDNSSPYIVSHYKNAHKVKHFPVRFS